MSPDVITGIALLEAGSIIALVLHCWDLHNALRTTTERLRECQRALGTIVDKQRSLFSVLVDGYGEDQE